MYGRSLTRTAIATLAVIVLVLAACSDDDDRDDSLVTDPPRTTPSTEPTTTTGPTTTTDPDAELKAEIAAAYEAELEAFIEILSDPDPTNPLIEQHYTDRTKERVLDTVAELILEGQRVRKPDNPDHWVVEVREVRITRPDRATVTACEVDGAVVYQADTGEVVNANVVTRMATAQMWLEDGRWKKARSEGERLEGNPGCED